LSSDSIRRGRLYRHHGHDGEPLAAPDKTHPFVRLGLEADASRLETQRSGYGPGYAGGMRGEPWRLADDRDVRLARDEAALLDQRHDLAQERHRVGILPLRIRVGKEVANAPGRHGAKQCVGDGMCDRVGIRVTGKPLRVGNALSAEDQRTPIDEAMGVIADANPHAAAPAVSVMRE
jgi:hypothetical protein